MRFQRIGVMGWEGHPAWFPLVFGLAHGFAELTGREGFVLPVHQVPAITQDLVDIFRPDLVVVLPSLTQWANMAPAVDKLEREGVPMVAWFGDDPWTHPFHLNILDKFERAYTPQETLVEAYGKKGRHLLPWTNPKHFKQPFPWPQARFDLGFLGAKSKARDRLLRRLADEMKAQGFSFGWHRGQLWGRDAASWMALSLVLLELPRFFDELQDLNPGKNPIPGGHPPDYLSPRVFHILALGKPCLLVGTEPGPEMRFPGLARLPLEGMETRVPAFLRENPDYAQGAPAWRAQVLAGHLGRHRAEAILEDLEES